MNFISDFQLVVDNFNESLFSPQSSYLEIGKELGYEFNHSQIGWVSPHIIEFVVQ